MVAAPAHLRGFGGLHGGLALGLATVAMASRAAGAPLRSTTAQFHRAVVDDVALATATVRHGRAITSVSAALTSHRGAHVTATAVFGGPGATIGSAAGPPVPDVPFAEACEVFTVPRWFVPIADQTEIRPVGPDRPFAGGDEPVLTAWIRLVDDDRPPDAGRLVFLLDALAPSYSAVLDVPQPIPTIELSVRPGEGLHRACSPWVLVSARSTAASPDGWIDERLDAWGPDGAHLGSAQQLRLLRSG